MLVCGPNFVLSYQDDHWGARIAAAKCSVQTKFLWSRVGLFSLDFRWEGQRSGFFQVVSLGKVSFSFFVTVENYFCFLSFQLELWLETFTSSQVASVVAIKIYFWELWVVSIFKLKGYPELEIKMTPHPPLQACIHILSGQYSFLPAPLPPDSCLPWDTHWISRICEEIGVSLGFSESIKTFCLFCEVVCFSCLVLLFLF